jgi:hypothetical protein
MVGSAASLKDAEGIREHFPPKERRDALYDCPCGLKAMFLEKWLRHVLSVKPRVETMQAAFEAGREFQHKLSHGVPLQKCCYNSCREESPSLVALQKAGAK